MIVVQVTLVSAIHPSRSKELARMTIANTGEDIDGTGRGKWCSYLVNVLRGRSREDFEKASVLKGTKIERWDRNAYHVWNLVALALKQMGYDKGHPK